MNLRKTFKEKNKNGYYLLLLTGIVLPILIPLSFAYFESADVSDFWLYIIICFLIFWILVFPSLCILHYYSIFFYRLSIFIGIVIPLFLSFHFGEVKVSQYTVTDFREKPIPKTNIPVDWDKIFEKADSNKSKPVVESVKPVVEPVRPAEEPIKSYVKLDKSVDNHIDILIISSGIFWLLMLIILWLYDGYLISKKVK
jgi:hypothetical protein